MGETFEQIFSQSIPIQRNLTLTNNQIKACLRELRQWGLFQPLLTAHYAPQVLETSWWLTLRSEKWSIIEQLCVALIDLRDFEKAQFYLIQLQNRFPGSQRVSLLKGLLLESQTDANQIEAHYAKLLDSDETDEGALKREISIHKSAGNIPLAIESLTGYLSAFMADTEAWKELASLYISIQRFRQAAFCLEELILASPENFHYCNLYADTLFSQGTTSSLILARDYY